MYLDISKEKAFNKLIKEINCNKINDLMVEVPIETFFKNLRTHTR